MKKYILIILISAILSMYNSVIADAPVFVYNLLDAIVESKDSRKNVLVIFTANWCPSCLAMKKDIEENTILLDNLIVCYVDYDKNQDLVKEYRVRIIPDYFIMRENIEIKRKTGYDGIKKLTSWIHKNE